MWLCRERRHTLLPGDSGMLWEVGGMVGWGDRVSWHVWRWGGGGDARIAELLRIEYEAGG